MAKLYIISRLNQNIKDSNYRKKKKKKKKVEKQLVDL